MADPNNPLPDSPDSFRPPALDDSAAIREKPPEPPPAVPPSEPLPSSPGTLSAEDKQMGMLCHLLGIVAGFLAVALFPAYRVAGFLGPLIIWLMKKDQSKFVDSQGKEALNFHLTLLIGHIIGGATMCFTFGLINAALAVVGIVFGIMGAMEANKGNEYRYPINIRMIK